MAASPGTNETAVAPPTRLAVLTSGGDSGGMNAAVRSVVRTALAAGVEVFSVSEGLQGPIDGGDRIRPATSADVGGILHQGGTVLGARSPAFRTRDGLRRAVRNLVERGIEALVVIGGDGSLSGAAELRSEWSGLIDDLVASGEIDNTVADAHRHLGLAGLVGSIDNDMFGTDMTIGTDTALRRIVEAVDAIQSTASSHQRTFVIEVMGRRCGYLALMGGLATGANFVFIPENPPGEDWEDAMCSVLRAGREIGRRANIVLVAEGARDDNGDPITATEVKRVLEERLGEDARVTVLGHVQRGGSPSTFDRFLGTLLGYAAVRQLLEAPGDEPRLIGIRGHHLTRPSLMECVAATRSIGEVIAERRFDTAMEMRGGSFTHSYQLLRTLVQARPHRAESSERVAARRAARRGRRPRDECRGAPRGAGCDGSWSHGARRPRRLPGTPPRRHPRTRLDVGQRVGARPGAALGTDRSIPRPDDLPRLAEQLTAHGVDGILMIGGMAGYVAAHDIATHGADHSGLDLPIVCLPSSINNDLPGTDLSIGSDTALNNIVNDIDKIKDSGDAARRCFIVEVTGNNAGYLALMAGLTTGAEQVYLPEEGISLARLQQDIDTLRARFESGNHLGLLIRSERAHEHYTTGVLASLMAAESHDVFKVRTAVLGQIPQGGTPSPFDRIQATRLAAAGVEHLIDHAMSADPSGAMVGLRRGKLVFTPLADLPELIERDSERPREQPWWMALRPLFDLMAGQTHAAPSR
jgi:6-phosphofructokinase 1